MVISGELNKEKTMGCYNFKLHIHVSHKDTHLTQQKFPMAVHCRWFHNLLSTFVYFSFFFCEHGPCLDLTAYQSIMQQSYVPLKSCSRRYQSRNLS